MISAIQVITFRNAHITCQHVVCNELILWLWGLLLKIPFVNLETVGCCPLHNCLLCRGLTERNNLIQAQHLPWSMKLHSRHRVQSPSRKVGLEAGPYHFPEDSSSPGASIHRSICKSLVSSATIIRQLETRPIRHRNRCLLHGLVQSPKQDLCQPSLGSDGQGPINCPQSGVWEMVLVAPVWKAQAWYPLLQRMLVREPLIIPQSQELIQSVDQNGLPDIIPQLAVWVISGVDVRTATF